MNKTTGALLALLLMTAPLVSAGRPRVLIKTPLGDIKIEIYSDKAPITAANFLIYVDAGNYNGSIFHRTVTLANQKPEDVKIEVIQGGYFESEESLPAIRLERTSLTGLRHTDGAISMARSGPDTATSSFFICIGDQPELDFGGKRNKDGQGFAAFGRVVAGMDVVRKIHRSPCEGQTLKPAIKILSIVRVGD